MKRADNFDETLTMTSAMTGSVMVKNESIVGESELIDDGDSDEETADTTANDFLGGDARLILFIYHTYIPFLFLIFLFICCFYIKSFKRYSSVAHKYNKFRALLAGAKADRAVRRPGKSVLDDLETIASDDKTVAVNRDVFIDEHTLTFKFFFF